LRKKTGHSKESRKDRVGGPGTPGTRGGYAVSDPNMARMIRKVMPEFSREQRGVVQKMMKSKKFTAKLKKMLVLISGGMSKNKAAIKAGYAQSASGFRAMTNAKREIQDLMEGTGLTDFTLIKHLTDGLDATKLVGDRIKEVVPDWTNKHRYLETALKLKGHLRDPNSMQSLNVGSIVLIRSGEDGNGKRKVINAKPHNS